MSKKRTTEEFIEKAKAVHGDKYDYSNVKYTISKEKVEIVCKKHGSFSQIASNHLFGSGCNNCGDEKRAKTTESFINKVKVKYENKYDYSKVDYINNRKNVIIICPYHGEFEKSPRKHLEGQECIKCKKQVKKSIFLDDALNNLIKIHGERYDYSKFIIKSSRTKGVIICKVHGEFEQMYGSHLSGQGCPKCGNERNWSRSNYIKRANGRICTFYTIRCFNEKESFYKIGITMRSTKERYPGIDAMPYTYEIISEIFGEAGFIWDLELKEKRRLKEFHYTPTIFFKGSTTECFSNLII